MTDKISPILLSAVKCCSVEQCEVICYLRGKNAFGRLSRFDVVTEYPFINAAGLLCYPHELERIAELSCVEYLTSSVKVSTLDDVTEIGAAALSRGSRLTGRGVTLCVMDTGIRPHTDLSIPENRITEFFDAKAGQTVFPYDDNGHGTFVAGVAAGNGTASGGVLKGVAPAARLVGVKVIDSNGEAGAFQVLDGMQWLVDNRKRLGVKVVCMSFGSTPTDVNDPLKRGAEVLVANGMTVVCASGNSGADTVKSPALSRAVIGVGAVDENGKVAEFTSRGYVNGYAKPEIYAKGVGVSGTSIDGTYGKMNGTSAAAPYVAGACCLLLERFPSLTPARIKEILLMSSRNIDGNFVLTV
jgi:Subtilisin-like serine proteases